MLTHAEAVARLLRLVRPTDAQRVPLVDALGRVLADPLVRATVDVPAFDNSAMDGYALRAADTPGRLRVVGESMAGAVQVPEVGPGTAITIATGGPMPRGADSVAPIENVELRDGALLVPGPVALGRHVRRAGHDTRAGETVRVAGELTPPRLAVLASLGIGTVNVRRRPRVAVMSTGDELVAPGEPLGPGQVHDSNSVSLAAATVDAGAEVVVLPRLADEADVVRKALRSAAETCDLVVTSGGVSVGPRDHVRAVIEADGELDFWRVAIQPGKPLAVGRIGGTPIIGLPGNPVSALVTFELFVRPFVRSLAGLDGDGRIHLRATSSARLAKDPSRRAFMRVVVSAGADGVLVAEPAGGQMSSQLRPMADANALMVVPDGADAAEPGGTYEVIMFEPALERTA